MMSLYSSLIPRPPLRFHCVLLVLASLIYLVLPGFALAQDSISEVVVVYGNNPVPAPPGYTRVNVDLNLGAGGDYMYVCFKKGVGAPITGFGITFGGHTMPAGWTRINIDLNRDAGGEYIYLWYTRDPACTTIEDVIILVNSQATPEGYTKIPWDLNHGAGGAYLYFAYKRI